MAYDFCEIDDVARICSHNIGGLNEAVLLPESYILSFPSYDFAFDAQKSASLSGTITLRNGATGYRFYFTWETGSFAEPMQENDSGVYYDQSFTLNIPKDRPEITWLKHRMRQGRYTILYRDANGRVKAARNLRVKFDLNTGKRGEEYNGHVMTARKASVRPALHWTMNDGDSLETLYLLSNIQYDTLSVSLPEGWQAGKKVELPHTPISLESIYATYNNSLILRPGTHFTLQGKTVTLSFSDNPDGGDAGNLMFFYAANRIGDGLKTFEQQTASKTAAYTSGETISLSGTPANADHIFIRMNQSLSLRPGTDFSISGSTVTLNFAGSPSISNPDTFHIYYATIDSSPAAISGWKHFSYFTAVGASLGTVIELPHTPIAGSLLVRLDDTLQLLESTDYNLTNDELQILWDIPAKSRIDCWYAYE